MVDLTAVPRRPRDGAPALACTELVGRDAQCERLYLLLCDPDVRLVSITGFAGVGKSALAGAVAGRAARHGAFSVATVPLPDRAVSGQLTGAVTAALRVGRTPPSGWGWRLLVLDGADHLGPAGRDYLRDLMDAHPELTILATTAVPLRMPGEHILRLGPLPAPDPARNPVDVLRTAPAVQLFIRRALAADASRAPADDLDAISEICHRLGGVPLAIELAAARVATLPPRALLAALDSGSEFDVLGGGEDPSPRHSSVRAALALTCDLLPRPERDLLARLGAFAGSFDVRSAGRVAGIGDEAALVDRLAHLVDARLVDPIAGGPAPGSFALPPLVRDFVRWHGDGVPAPALDAHRGVAGEACRRAAEMFDAGDRPGAFASLERAWPDIRLLLDRLMAAEQWDRALRIAVRCAPFLIGVGYDPRAGRSLAELTDRVRAGRTGAPGDIAGDIARGMLWSATAAGTESARASGAAAVRLAEGVAMAVAAGDEPTELLGLELSALAVPATLDLAAAMAAAQRGRLRARQVGDQRYLVRFEARCCMLAYRSGEIRQAVRYGSAALRRARRIGDQHGAALAARQLLGLPPGPSLPPLPSVPDLLAVARDCHDHHEEMLLLGLDAFRRVVAHDLSGAAGQCRACLMLLCELGALSTTEPLAPLMTAAILAARRDDARVAADLAAALTPWMPVLSITVLPWKLSTYRQAAAGLLDEGGARRDDDGETPVGGQPPRAPSRSLIWSTIDYLQRVAVSEPAAPFRPATDGPDVATVRLTDREWDVLRLMSTDRSNREIAAELGISPKTVMHHAGAVYGKLGVRGRAGAVAWMVRSAAGPLPAHQPPAGST